MTSPNEHVGEARTRERRRIAGSRLWGTLLLILLLGAFLRFHGTGQLEPQIWDEGCYLLEARYLSSFSTAVWNSAKLFIEERRTGKDLWKRNEQFQEIREKTRGTPPRYGRILHDTLLATANLAAGESPHRGNQVSALFGTLTILWVFLLGRMMYGDRVGLYAALIFAVMGYHVHYSRSWLAEANTLFFVVPAFAYYYRSRCRPLPLSQRDLALCGLWLGIGFTAHNRCVVLFGLLVLLDLLASRKAGEMEGPRTRTRTRILLLSSFFLIPSFLWESFYHMLFIAFRRLHVVMTAPTYLEQMLQGFWHSLLWGYVSENFRPSGFLTFPYLYNHMNGIVASLLLGVGLFAAWKRRSLPDRILGAWFVFPYVLYSLTNAGLTRFFSIILPPAAILSAAALAPRPGTNPGIGQRPIPAFIGPAVLVLLVATGIYSDWTRVLPPASGYGRTMAYLDRAGGQRLIATGTPLCQVYAGVDAVKRPPPSMEELESLYEAGFRYYVIDYNRIIYTYYQMDRVRVMDRIAGRLDPVFTTSNEFILRPQNAFEGNLYFWNTLAMLRKGRQEGIDRIRVYDLKAYFEPRADRATARLGPGTWEPVKEGSLTQATLH